MDTTIIKTKDYIFAQLNDYPNLTIEAYPHNNNIGDIYFLFNNKKILTKSPNETWNEFFSDIDQGWFLLPIIKELAAIL